MSLARFFLEEQVLADQVEPEFSLQLSADDVHHLRVLRLRSGDHIAVIDADRDYFECEITDVGGELPTVRIARHDMSRVQRPHVLLVQGLARGEKMDDVFCHATELGVEAFVPLKCERSVLRIEPKRVEKRMARWNAIVKSASMQSGQPDIPKVYEPQTVGECRALLADYTCVLVFWEEAPLDATVDVVLDAMIRESDVDPNRSRVAVVVGPEGGLAQSEVSCFADLPQAAVVTLGPTILRTETAGVVAPAIVLHELGRLQRGWRA